MWQNSPVCSLVLTCTVFCLAVETADAQAPESDRVGWFDSSMLTPVNSRLTPFGDQLGLPGMRPQAICLNPDRSLLAVSGKTSQLLIVDPTTQEILQRVDLPSRSQNKPPEPSVSENILNPDRRGQVSYTGLMFSPDGRQIFLSDVNGGIKVFSVDEDNQVSPSHTIELPNANAPRRSSEIPSGICHGNSAQSILVCGNLSNRLLELDIPSGEITRTFDVGIAPYDVVRHGRYAVVSNWAGARPNATDTVGPAGRGIEMRVDPERYIANSGSVSIIDLESGETREVTTGLHPSALVSIPNSPWTICANASSDNLSVIDVEQGTVSETIWVKPKPSDLYGATPNALAFDAETNRLYVANANQNAIAILDLDLEEKGDSHLLGLVPVGWFPGAIALDTTAGRIHVANIKGLPKQAKKYGDSEGFNSHHYHGSISSFSIPNDIELADLSLQVAKNEQDEKVRLALRKARPNQPARVIPERIGEPSLIQHVVYIIKENRTYDQVLGDMPNGNGEPSLCIFGREITPNMHALADQFGLLDNTYCAGILSADGHQWSTSAITTDYMEKSFAGFPRSYPDGMGIDDIDAMAYSPAGFLWDNARLHGVSIRNYGEFMMPNVRFRDTARSGSPGFLDCYRTWQGNSDAVLFGCEPGIESVREFSPLEYVGWNMSVPDQYRADFILNELKQFESAGSFPQLTIICLPNDHTSGTAKGCPTPAACMADNDLAFGRIVEGLSHSPFWPSMAIFVIEDDPQAGWDHVSGYRTTAWTISPYSRRGQTIRSIYNTASVLRTIEQILGMPPMNRYDASADPMFDCFVDQPDLTPYSALPNRVPLDQMNPDPIAILDEQLRSDAELSSTFNFAHIDAAPEDAFNRILWRAQRGSHSPFPEWAISFTDEEDDD